MSVDEHDILPVGTKVVLEEATETRRGPRPKGSVGVVVRAPHDEADEPYAVRFADGEETTLDRHQIAVLSHFQRPEWIRDDRPVDLSQFVIFRCVVGSQAYGLATESSDVDRRGFYLPPAEEHWSLSGVPEQLEDKDEDAVYWEYEKFLGLALEANPHILECLYTPVVEEANPVGERLVDHREIFLSELVYQTYSRYVMSQFERLRRAHEKTGEVDSDHAMHLVRLLMAGVGILERGFVPVDVSDHREWLLAVKRGEVEWHEVDRRRRELHERFDRAFEQTDLPERPDYERADELLVEARRWASETAWDEESGWSDDERHA